MKPPRGFGRGRWGSTLAFAGATAVAMSVWSAERGAVDPSTREMGRLLAELATKVDPRKMPFQVDDRRAELLAEDLTQPRRPVVERLQLRFSYASALLRAGRTSDCLKAIEAMKADVIMSAPDRWETDRPEIELLKAKAYLRMAEELNCHLANNRDSCLLPIRGQGIHQNREGATRAAEVLTGLLDADSSNLQARWLLNIAHMTLGSYPDGVSKRDLIPPDVFASEFPLPTFENVARQVGRGRVWPGWRRNPGRFRQRRPARPHGVPFGLRRPDALLPESRRRHVRGPHGQRRPHGGGGRPEHAPGRLRQRWPCRCSGAARRDGWGPR